MLRLVLTKHKCLTVFTGGSGHGHGTKAVFCAVQNVLHNAVHNWAVFYASGGMVSRLNFQRVPKRVLFENGFLKIIDSFRVSSRIAPNMNSAVFTVITPRRTRRTKPTSLRRLGVFCFDGGTNATVR